MLSLQNKDKKDSKDFYFACSQSPYNWKLTKDPYSDIRRKKFPILKYTYHSMRGYNNVIINIINKISIKKNYLYIYINIFKN